MRRPLVCVATVILAAIDIAAATGTPPRYIAQSGYWTAFMGSIPEGAPACGMSTTGGTSTVQMFMVKWFYGNAYLTIQILKENWHIPKNATGEIWITFDRGTPFYGNASAHQSGNTLELTIPIRLIDNFLSEFREADKMYVSFRNGNELPWTANMTGSRAVAIAFEQCVKNFLEQIKQGQPTQPYASQPTQPYSLQPPPVAAATQPSPSQPSKDASTGWTGSGFFVTTAGHILTNAHVAQGCFSPMVRAVGNTPVAASVVALDSKIDLALMKTATRPIKVAPLRGTPPVSVGDEIIIFGFPLSGMLSSSGNATFGNISAALGMLDNPNHLQVSAAVQSGNSGGPLLDRSGNVIGIVFAKLGMRAATLTGDLPQNINFAVKSSVAAKFLSDQGIAFETSEKTAELPKAEIVEMAKSFSVEITCDSASVSQPGPQERPAIAIEKRSAEFLVNHYAAVSSGNNAALEYAMRTYAPELEYYGQKKSRSDVIGQITRSYSRWPIRKYSIEEHSVSIECNESARICKAKGIILFDARSTERGQHSRGRATFEYTLKYSEVSASPVIVQENGATLARHVEALGK